MRNTFPVTIARQLKFSPRILFNFKGIGVRRILFYEEFVKFLRRRTVQLT